MCLLLGMEKAKVPHKGVGNLFFPSTLGIQNSTLGFPLGLSL